MADIDIPVPLPSLIPFFGDPFILVTVMILGFVPAPWPIAFIVVLLAIQVPGTVPRLPVSVLTAPMGLISVAVVMMWGVVVMGGIFLWLHIGRVSTLLGF